MVTENQPKQKGETEGRRCFLFEMEARGIFLLRMDKGEKKRKEPKQRHAEETAVTMSNKKDMEHYTENTKILLPRNVIPKNASQRKAPKQTTSVKNDKRSRATSLTVSLLYQISPSPPLLKRQKKEKKIMHNVY